MGSFNSDMDSYLSGRKRERAVKVVKMETNKKTFAQKIFGFFSGDDEEMDETSGFEETVTKPAASTAAEKAYPEEKKAKSGFFSKVKDFFSTEEEEEKDVPIILVPDDVKDLLKIQNKWLMKLSPRTIKEFKETEDYTKMKVTLEKYGLLKKN